MRLSKRERFLLAVLTLLLLWTGFYKFWIEPETDLLFANLQEINRLEEQIKRGGPPGKTEPGTDGRKTGTSRKRTDLFCRYESGKNGQKAFAACRRN